MSKRDKHAQRSADFTPGSFPLAEVDEALFGKIQQADARRPGPETAIVAKGRGIADIGKRVHVYTVGAEFDAALTEPEWKSFFEVVRSIRRAVQWIVGDWATYGEHAFQWTYEDMAELTGFSAKTLREYAYVARSVPMSIRMDAISFGHHQVVSALPEHQQKSWLQYAQEKHLSVAQLRQAVRESPTLPEEIDPLGAKTFARNARIVRRIVDRVGGGKALSNEERQSALAQIELLRQWLAAAERLVRDTQSDEPL